MKNMKKPKKIDKNSNKGFTLVELLAVIVVLALLVLIAGRAVTGQITKARRNTFRTESIAFAKAMETYFDIAVIEEGGSFIEEMEVGDEPELGNYLCQPLSFLEDKGYIKNASSAGYSGYIQVLQKVADNDGTVYETMVVLSITNGKYTYKGTAPDVVTLKQVIADKSFKKQTINSEATPITKDCPSSASALLWLKYIHTVEGRID